MFCKEKRQSQIVQDVVQEWEKEKEQMAKRTSRSGPYYGWDNNKDRVCTIDQVNDEQLSEFQNNNLSDFKVADWFIVLDHQEKSQILGPFKSSQAAFDHCVKNLDIELISNDLNTDPNFTFGND